MSDLYELPNGWEWNKLEKLTKLQNGFAFKSNLFVDSGLPIVRIKNIKNEKVLLDDVVYFKMEDYGKKLDTYQIKRNDILIAMSGATTGKIGLYESDEIAYLNQRVGLFRIDNSDLRSYLFYFLSTQIEKNLEQSLGAAQPNLSTQQINDIEIPLPPLSEQQRIVSKLDKLFEKIDKSIALHQKNIDEADVFMGSVLNDVFGELEEKYETRILGNLTKTTSGGTPSRNQKSYWGGNIGWLKSGELNDSYITEVEEYITEEGLNKSSAKLFPKGTLLIAMYGATVGRLGILNIETTTNQAICGILNDKNEFETLFMFYFLKKIREKMLKDSFGGAQPNISQTYIKELGLPLPPLQVQQKVVSYLDEISQKMEKIKQIQKEKMDSLKALKASILDKAFRGEL